MQTSERTLFGKSDFTTYSNRRHVWSTDRDDHSLCVPSRSFSEFDADLPEVIHPYSCLYSETHSTYFRWETFTNLCQKNEAESVEIVVICFCCPSCRWNAIGFPGRFAPRAPSWTPFTTSLHFSRPVGSSALRCTTVYPSSTGIRDDPNPSHSHCAYGVHPARFSLAEKKGKEDAKYYCSWNEGD